MDLLNWPGQDIKGFNIFIFINKRYPEVTLDDMDKSRIEDCCTELLSVAGTITMRRTTRRNEQGLRW